MNAAQALLRDGLTRTEELLPKQGYIDALLGVGQRSGPFGTLEAGLRLPHDMSIFADGGWERDLGWNAGVGWKWTFQLP